MNWHSIGKESDLAEGRSLILELEGKQVAIFKTGAAYFAIDNVCPHRGGPLGEGHLEDKQLTCPWHAWTFDLTTGQCVNIPSAKVQTFRVKTENGQIWVET